MSLTLARKIQLVRKAAELTQDDLAKRIGVTRGAVTQWESRNEATRTTPEMAKLRQFADICKVPFTWLIDDKFAADDARNVRELFRQGRWQEMPVKLEDGYPDGAPKFVRSTVIEPIGALLHTETEAELLRQEPSGYGIQPRHPRLGQLFWNAVEYACVQSQPEAQQRFQVRLAEGIAHADYFDGKNLVEFASVSTTVFMGMIERTVGQLLFYEKLIGHDVRKWLLIWGASPDQPARLDEARELAQRADVELRYITDVTFAADLLLDLNH